MSPNQPLPSSSSSGTGITAASEKKMSQPNDSKGEDVEKAPPTPQQPTSATEWNGPDDVDNPLNWPAWKRRYHVVPPSVISFAATLGSSVYAPAVSAVKEQFNVSSTVALLPLTFYVIALGFGPLIAAPVSETAGRNVVYLLSVPLGALFTMGAGFSQNIWTMCILRFFAGTMFSPALAIGAGTIADTTPLEKRGLPSCLYVLGPFLGPSLGPVIGSFVTVRKSWRWTQWTIVFFAILCIILNLFMRETYKKTILLRRAKKLGIPIPPGPPMAQKLKFLLTVTLLRPLHMLATEPIVAFLSFYTSFNFSVLFAFFAAFPYVFRMVYGFTIEQSGLVFIGIGIGCLLAVVTVVLCDIFLYQRQVRASVAAGNGRNIPPEYRLYPAMMGAFGIPISLFWFGWSARSDVSWASPVVAAIPFGWGNLTVFIATATYTLDTYQALNGASALAANGFLRYALGGVFPLFTLQMYESLGIGWATSLLGFVAAAMIPLPWVLFKWGPSIRARSSYDVIKI